jgi:hypothetical protein
VKPCIDDENKGLQRVDGMTGHYPICCQTPQSSRPVASGENFDIATDSLLSAQVREQRIVIVKSCHGNGENSKQ